MTKHNSGCTATDFPLLRSSKPAAIERNRITGGGPGTATSTTLRLRLHSVAACASSLVKETFSTVERLKLFPESGHVPPELPDSIYRELYVRPCRIFYRNEDGIVLILHVMREESQMRRFLLDPELNS
jgi:plasmid stabilization system protein ParE